MAKYAIYGFFFSKDFSTKRASFSVINEDIKFYDKVKKTQDRKNYNLSGYIETSESDLEGNGAFNISVNDMSSTPFYNFLVILLILFS